MISLDAVLGDIAQQSVDVIVNAANTAVRAGGGHGVNGAVHRAGGPAIERECESRFPNGLAVGDAGATTAGSLPARWVVHVVGPDRTSGQDDPALVASCYRRALAVADDLGARSVAFPLLGAGAHGWPRKQAIAIALDSMAATDTRVREIRLVTSDDAVHRSIQRKIFLATPVRILQAVRLLHQHGYHRIRVLPGMSASGMHWRVRIADALSYTTGSRTDFAGGQVTVMSRPEGTALLILGALPPVAPTYDDPEYVAWYAALMDLVGQHDALPIAYADYFDDREGWEVGWCSGRRYPHPPRPR